MDLASVLEYIERKDLQCMEERKRAAEQADAQLRGQLQAEREESTKRLNHALDCLETQRQGERKDSRASAASRGSFLKVLHVHRREMKSCRRSFKSCWRSFKR